MIKMTSEEYWREKAHEPLRFEKVIMTDEEMAEIERKHPTPTTEEELIRLVEEAGGDATPFL